MDAVTPIIELKNLKRYFGGEGGLFSEREPIVRALREASLNIAPGETVAIVGESGSGKTTLGRLAALLDQPSDGEVLIKGTPVTALGRAQRKPLHRIVQMIFQDPFSSLNPRRTVGESIAEPLVIHKIGTRADRRDRVIDLLQQVGLKPEDASRYPHQFSGGQRQRIAIARALSLEPELLIADEAVSALDVSVQSQILNLLKDLQSKHGIAMMFISHDLDVVRHIADRTLVMYLGAIVEAGPTEVLFDASKHPYTQALLAARPRLGLGKRRHSGVPKGETPSPINPPSGCAFHPRCPLADDRCAREAPGLEQTEGRQGLAACWKPGEVENP